MTQPMYALTPTPAPKPVPEKLTKGQRRVERMRKYRER